VWSGGPTDRLNQNASLAVTEVRKLLADEHVEEAEKLADLGLVSTPQAMRFYQTLGNIEISFDGDLGDYTNGSYKRWLDLNDATAGVQFSVNDTQIERELFASAPDGVIVHKLTATGGSKLAFQMRVNRPQDNINTASDKSFNTGGNTVIMTGAAGSSNPIVFAAGLTIQTDGNLKAWGEFLVVDNATEAITLFAATTTYREDDPAAAVEATFNKARQYTYEELRQRHVGDYQNIYQSCSLELGSPNDNSSVALLPTNERINATQNGTTDLGLITLQFSYGRYLLISSSRPGTLPANLQGIWNEDFESAWGSKYTININTEMNYWPAELTNLPSLHHALFDHIEKVRVNGEIVARDMYNASGWVVHHNTDIHGDAAPQDRYPPASYWTLTPAWLCTHILEHYFYNHNQTFLLEKLPTLTGAIQFYLDTLQPYDRNGTTYLVTNPSTSPENYYFTPANASGSMAVGPTCDFQILHELFTGYKRAVSTLSEGTVDATFLDTLDETVARFPPPQISTRYPGVLQEWINDYEEAEPGHRHISHLYALYPGTQIPPPNAPGHNETMWNAARRTLEYRLQNGGAGTGWSRAWTINWYARLLNGTALADNIYEFFNQSTYPNLFDAHPPFQIDGNFGFTSGVAEALLQSHFVDDDGVREVWLLPALPEAWVEGSVKGLVARGGFVVNIKWDDGRVKKVAVHSQFGGKVRFRFDVAELGGGRVASDDQGFDDEDDGKFALSTEEDVKYEFTVSWD
jgi:alpha-L-fucosidase 2